MFDLERTTFIGDELKPSGDEVGAARRWRETDWSIDRGMFESATPDPGAGLTDQQIVALVPAAVHDIIYEFEVSGKSGYNRKYRQPEWPGGGSGITIGVGYDIGVQSAKDFEKAFKGVLDPAVYDRLVPYVGFTTSKTYADVAVRIARAKQIVQSLRDIDIPWEQAEAAYLRFSVPVFARATVRVMPNALELHADSFGALFSLVYNRGPGMAQGDQRREMRNIRDEMRDRQFSSVPSEFRSMKRLWEGDLGGLVKRREQEARLFEKGLSAKAVAIASAAPVAGGTAGGVYESATTGNAYESFDHDLEGWNEELEGGEYTPEVLEAQQPWDGVQWPKNDDESPEYRHIRNRALANKTFTFTPADLELLLLANRFDPARGNERIVFGLRGAMLVKSLADATQVPVQPDSDALTLLEMRPDHRTFRCTIGVYDLKTKKLSGFIANTVPNAWAVHAAQQGEIAGCNLLPSGRYTFTVGWHNPKSSNVPGCLIESGAPRCVIRTKNDLKYDFRDWFDPNPPGDNIHPAFNDKHKSAQFSSLGCQTIRGNYIKEKKEITGEYVLFRKAMGFGAPGDKADNGKLFDYVLLTGLEAAVAADLRARKLETDTGVIDAELGCLRQGSRGDLVRRLQAALGLPVTGDFDPKLKRKLADVQRAKLGWADGVYSPDMDDKLKIAVFATPPVVVAAAAPAVRAASGGTQLESAVSPVPVQRLESLYYELGARSRMALSDLEGFSARPIPDPSLHEAFLGMEYDDVVNVGQRVFDRIERSVQALVCGDAEDDKGDRSKIRQALNSSATISGAAVVETLKWIVSTYLLLQGPISQLVAQIVYERVLKPAIGEGGKALLDDGCQLWAKRLRMDPAPAPAAGQAPVPAPAQA